MPRLSSCFATPLVLFALACSPDDPGGDPMRTVAEETRPEAPPLAPFDECVVTVASETSVSAAHLTICSELDFPEHPPASGAHYGQWAEFGIYDAPIPWGFLLHSMEHGAVVLAYNCRGDDCATVTAALEEIARARVDPLCRGADLPARFVVVPDPTLDVAIAAVSWEHVYLATCLDRPSLEAFVEAHYGRGPEDTCAPGVDRSDAGWCE